MQPHSPMQNPELDTTLKMECYATLAATNGDMSDLCCKTDLHPHMSSARILAWDTQVYLLLAWLTVGLTF